MNEISFGRKLCKKENDPLRRFRNTILLGAVAVSMILCLEPDRSEVYIKTSADVSTDNNGDVSAEPFGYFMGKWNIWEFIGDSVSSFLP